MRVELIRQASEVAGPNAGAVPRLKNDQRLSDDCIIAANNYVQDHNDAGPDLGLRSHTLSSLGSDSADVNPWRRTISQLSMGAFDTAVLPAAVSSAHDVWKSDSAVESQESVSEASRSVACTVETDGLLKGPFYDRHVTYRVQKESWPAVVRRFRDFFWLRSHLADRYPHRIIPTLPRKSLVAGMDPIASNILTRCSAYAVEHR